MIRSEVGVTDFAPLAPDSVYVPEPDRVVFTTSFEDLLTDRDAFCFFVITRPFGISQMGIDTYHIKPALRTCTQPQPIAPAAQTESSTCEGPGLREPHQVHRTRP